ncbi:MAG: hypothetical protein WDZ77_01880 [Candidatus Pacearchaeota archaeon]
MIKRGLFLSFLAFLFEISFVEAQGISSVFYNSIDPSTIILLLVFIVSFALLNYAFSKFFTGNAITPAIISLSLSLGVTYGINRYLYESFEGFLFNIGISEGMLYLIGPIALLFALGILWWKKNLGKAITGMGILILIIVSFTDLFYEVFITGLIGFVLLVLGIWFWRRENKKKAEAQMIRQGYLYPYEQQNKKEFLRKGFTNTANTINKGRNYIDPRTRLARYKEKENLAQEKTNAKNQLRLEKQKIKRQKELSSKLLLLKKEYQKTNSEDRRRYLKMEISQIEMELAKIF